MGFENGTRAGQSHEAGVNGGGPVRPNLPHGADWRLRGANAASVGDEIRDASNPARAGRATQPHAIGVARIPLGK